MLDSDPTNAILHIANGGLNCVLFYLLLRVMNRLDELTDTRDEDCLEMIKEVKEVLENGKHKPTV